MQSAELADAQLVGACAHAAGSDVWRARFFATAASTADAIQLTLLDDVAVDGSAPCSQLVQAECVLPSGESVELASVPATETIAEFKLRLRRVWSFSSSAPAEAADDAFSKFPASRNDDSRPAAAQPALDSAPSEPVTPGTQAQMPPAPVTPGARRTTTAFAGALEALSLALSGARLVGAWHPATNLAAIVAGVAIVTSLVGYLPVCAASVAVLYARVHHEQRARMAAQAEVEQMRAEVHAAHRQITATVAALARADEGAHCGVLNSRGGAEEDTTLWLNNAFAQCWTGWLNAWLSTTLASAVSDGLRQRKPAGLDEWGLVSLELEETAPRLSAPHILRSAKVGAEQTNLDFGLSIVGDVSLRMRLTASVSLLRAKITLPVTFRVRELRVASLCAPDAAQASAADITVKLAFIRSPPYVRTVRVSMLAAPRISAQLGSMCFTEIPGVDVAVQGALEGALRKMLVEPNGHVWDIEEWWLAEQLKAK